MGGSLYGRIFSFLRPHSAVLVAAAAATAVFAVMDASVYILLIPFVETLFVSGGAAPGSGGDGGMSRVLEATVYRWVDVTGDPMYVRARKGIAYLP